MQTINALDMIPAKLSSEIKTLAKQCVDYYIHVGDKKAKALKNKYPDTCDLVALQELVRKYSRSNRVPTISEEGLFVMEFRAACEERQR